MSVTIVSFTRSPDNLVVERFTDHLGKAYKQWWRCAPSMSNAEVEATVNHHATQLAESLADAEAEQVIE